MIDVDKIKALVQMAGVSDSSNHGDCDRRTSLDAIIMERNHYKRELQKCEEAICMLIDCTANISMETLMQALHTIKQGIASCIYPGHDVCGRPKKSLKSAGRAKEQKDSGEIKKNFLLISKYVRLPVRMMDQLWTGDGTPDSSIQESVIRSVYETFRDEKGGVEQLANTLSESPAVTKSMGFSEPVFNIRDLTNQMYLWCKQHRGHASWFEIIFTKAKTQRIFSSAACHRVSTQDLLYSYYQQPENKRAWDCLIQLYRGSVKIPCGEENIFAALQPPSKQITLAQIGIIPQKHLVATRDEYDSDA